MTWVISKKPNPKEFRRTKSKRNIKPRWNPKNDLAVLYKEQARYEEAESLLLEAIEGCRLKLGDTHPNTLESWNNLIALYEAWGKPEKADEWRAKLPQTEAVDE